MAESDKFNKKTRPITWIILAVVVIAVIAWLFVDRTPSTTSTHEDGINKLQTESLKETDDWNVDPVTWGDDSFMDEDDNAYGADYSGAVGTDVTAPGNQQQFSRVDAFVSFTEETDASELNRKTTYEGLVKLAAAIEELDNESQADEIKEKAEQLKEDQMTDQQAIVIQETVSQAATAIENIQQDKFPDLENQVKQLKNAAQKIDSGDLASNQKEPIMNFFNEAAQILESMGQQKDDLF